MAKSLFRRGYETAKEEAKKAEARRAAYGKKLFEFYLTAENNEADVVFLNEEPINCYTHQRVVRRGGRELFDTVVCSQDDTCPDCEGGDRPTYKGVYLVVDLRPYETTNEKGKKVTKNETLRLYLPGNRVVSQLDRISTKYGLANKIMTIVRSGKGTGTNYIVENSNEDIDFSRKQLESMLTDGLKKIFDGTEESLYEIIEEQLKIRLSNIEEETDQEDEEEEEETDRKQRANLVRGRSSNLSSKRSIENDAGDEEEDEQSFSRRGSSRKKSLFKARR